MLTVIFKFVKRLCWEQLEENDLYSCSRIDTTMIKTNLSLFLLSGRLHAINI